MELMYTTHIYALMHALKRLELLVWSGCELVSVQSCLEEKNIKREKAWIRERDRSITSMTYSIPNFCMR